MKEIKAYVKLTVLERVVAALNESGFRSMTVIEVAGLGDLIDPKDYKYSLEFVEKTSKVAKIELVSSEEDAAKVVDIIKRQGRTSQPGDGIIYISSVERAVKIQTRCIAR